MTVTPTVDRLRELRAEVGEKNLQPKFKLDEATRKRYRDMPIMRGIAATKTEQMYLGEAVTGELEVKTRVSSQ